MPKRLLYDTRFFTELFYTSDKRLAKNLKDEIRSVKEKLVSSLTIHEIYRMILRAEGKEVATLRCSTIKRDFEVIDVNYEIAIRSAELRGRHQMPMADSIIAITALSQGCPLFSDDAHFKQIKDLHTVWV